MPNVWRFWPLVLVLLGVAMVMGKQSLKIGSATIAGLLLGVLIAGVFCTDWAGSGGGGGIVEQEFSYPYDPGIRSARLNLDAGAGSFSITRTCTSLVEAKTSTSIGRYDLHAETEDSLADIHIDMNGRKPGWRVGGWENRVSLALNERPEWKLDMDVGAAKVDLDLRPYRLRTLNLDAGATTVEIRLGALGEETEVAINAGASSIRMEVPSSAGCEIHAEAPLSSKRFPGFKRVGEGVYRTENYETADHRIEIRLEAGVSSLKVMRVEPS